MGASSGEAVGFTAVALGAAVSFCILSGLVVRFILMPYLREHLLTPVQETHHQVTENNGGSEQPTVLDAIHDVQRDVTALARVMDAHMDWSDRWTDLWEREIARLKEQLRRNGARADDQDSAT